MLGKFQRNLSFSKKLSKKSADLNAAPDFKSLNPLSTLPDDSESLIDGQSEVLRIEGRDFLLTYKHVDLSGLSLKAVPPEVCLFKSIEVPAADRSTCRWRVTRSPACRESSAKSVPWTTSCTWT